MITARRLRWSVLAGIALVLAGCSKRCSGYDPNVRVATVRGRAMPPLREVMITGLDGTLTHTAIVDGSGRYEIGVIRADLEALKGVHFFHLQAPAGFKEGEAWVTSAQFVPRKDVDMPTVSLWNPAVAVDRMPDGGLRVSFDGVPMLDFQHIHEYFIQLEFRGVPSDPKKGPEESRRATARAHSGENIISPSEVKRLLSSRTQEPVKVAVEAQGDDTPMALRYHAGVVTMNLPLGE